MKHKCCWPMRDEQGGFSKQCPSPATRTIKTPWARPGQNITLPVCDKHYQVSKSAHARRQG